MSPRRISYWTLAALAVLTACGGGGAGATLSAPSAPPEAGQGVAQRCTDAEILPGCFLKIDGGSFGMGAQATDPAAPGYDPAARPDEGPVRTVKLPAYWIQATEVPFAMRERCRVEKACSVPPDPGGSDDAAVRDLPARMMTYAEAEELCRWLGGRLPTEAEWEAAARGAAPRRFAWGDAPTCPATTREAYAAAEAHRNRIVQRCDGLFTAVFDGLTPAQLTVLATAADTWTEADVDAFCPRLRALPVEEKAAAMLALSAERIAAHQASRAAPTCDRPDLLAVATINDGHPGRLIGLSGNVAEWVSGGADPASGRQVVRGGSHVSEDLLDWRLTARQSVPADARLGDVGLRCVREAAP